MMNRYVKLAGEQWGVGCLTKHEPGTTVTVTKANGATKQVTLGDFIYANRGCHVFAIAVAAKPAPTAVGDLSGILALFDKAKRHLKFPAINLALPGQGGGMRISVAGERARVPGSLSITASEKGTEGRREWFGRVLRDGNFEASNSATSAVADQLRAFAADPVKVASDHAKLTGNCCFCNRKLEDERSTAVGYGSACSENYGLPWGARPAKFADAA